MNIPNSVWGCAASKNSSPFAFLKNQFVNKDVTGFSKSNLFWRNVVRKPKGPHFPVKHVVCKI